MKSTQKLIFLSLLLVFASLSLASAQQATLGTYAKGSTINLIQTCMNSTYSNVTRVSYPNSSFALNTPTVMTKNGFNYNSSFALTSALGTYLVYGACDPDANPTSWVYDFKITQSGEDTRNFDYLPTVLALLGVISACLVISFSLSDDHGALKLVFLIMPLFFMIGLLNVANSTLKDNFSSTSVSANTSGILIFLPYLVWAVLLYFMGYLLYKTTLFTQQQARMKAGGEE